MVKSIFSQRNLILAAVVVAVLMFAVPPVMASETGVKITEKVGARPAGFLFNLVGAAVALYVARRFAPATK